MKPVRYEVGDTVRIDDQGFQNILHGHKSINAHPSGSFVEKTRLIHEQGTVGTVTHTFPPGYEMTVDFGGQYMHMKDYWVTRS
ncbi:MAG: hypothetical protein WC997_17615 [Porticoccaceae bacterium]